MTTTLEQVELLREKANVNYDEAKEALESSDGDLLDALIYLEKKGKVTPPAGGGYYSSEKSLPEQGFSQQKGEYDEKYNSSAKSGVRFRDLMRRFGRFCAKLVHKGNINTLEVIKDGVVKTAFPVTLLVILLVFAFWITVPLLILGLFFGYRYQFRGPDLEKEVVNEAMDSVANTAEELKRSFAKEEHK